MINNEKFNLATGGNTYNVVPLVIIVSDSGLVLKSFSTQPININSLDQEPISFDPLLLNVSSIKESVDVETRKYKTSSVTITLSNSKYLGRRLSDSYTDIINGDVEIYFKTQNITDLSRTMLVYKGRIKRISQTDTTLILSAEDASEQKVHKDIPESLTNEIDFKSKFKNKPFPMVIGKVDRSPCVTSFGTTGEYDIDASGDLDDYDFVRDVFADKKELSKIIPDNVQVGNNTVGSTSLFVEMDEDYIGIYPRNEINFESGLSSGDVNYTPLASNNGFAFVNLFNDDPIPNQETGEITIEELAKNDTAANRGRILFPRKEFKIEAKTKAVGTENDFVFKSGIVDGESFIEDENLNFDRINDGNPNSCVQIEGTYKLLPNSYSHAYLKFHFESYSGVKIDNSDTSTWTRIIAKTQILDRSVRPIGTNSPYYFMFLPLIGVFTQENGSGGKLLFGDNIPPKNILINNDETRLKNTGFNELTTIEQGGVEYTDYFNSIKAPALGDEESGLQQTFATAQEQYNSFQGFDHESPISLIHPALVSEQSNFYCFGLPKIGNTGLGIGFDLYSKFRIFESHLWAFGTVDNLLNKNFYANVWGRKSEFNVYTVETIDAYIINENNNPNVDHVQDMLEVIMDGTGETFDSIPFLTSDQDYSYSVFPIKAIHYNNSDNTFQEINIDNWSFRIDQYDGVQFLNFSFTGLTQEEDFSYVFTIQLGNLQGEIVEEFELAFDIDSKENILITPIENPADIVKHILEEECKYDGEFNNKEFNAIKELHPNWNFAFTQSKLISSKKLIEDFSRSTKSFPRFRADGTFGWNVVKDTYTDDDLDLIVDESDIINYRYDRTKLEDVKTKVKVLFNIDYAKGNHLFSTDDILATDYVNTNIYDYYSLANDDSDSTLNFESDYIRDRYTAEQLRNWLLTWNMNQKNLISLTLPIKYIKLEVGDVVALDKEIQGTKIFGETYTQRSIKRNGQEIYPYFMVYETNKNLEKVDIKLIQLHNLDINSLGTVEEPEAQQEESNVVLPTGDINGDGNTDVVDIVSAIGYILGAKELTDEEFFQADINQDGNVDVLDVVTLVNIILG